MTTVSLDEERQTLMARVLAARTASEISAARNALRQWLKDHPHDTGLRAGFEQLSLMEDIVNERCGAPSPHSPR